MKKELWSIEDDLALLSKTSIHEKRPLHPIIIVLLLCVLLVLLGACFVMDENFSINQMSFLGIFGASIISVFTILITLNHENRSRYVTARRSALMLTQILDSVHFQVERINNGSNLMVAYPSDWIRYYENCCTYLKYNYLPYLLREFDIIEKINDCVKRNDSSGIKRLIEYRNKGITDWTLNFNILSVKTNLSSFSAGWPEAAPWKQQKKYKDFKEYISNNYSDKIKQLTISYLNDHNGRVDSNDAEYFVMEQLKLEEGLQAEPYRYVAMENRALLNAIRSVYLSRKPEDMFELCWGELSLKTHKVIPNK